MPLLPATALFLEHPNLVSLFSIVSLFRFEIHTEVRLTCSMFPLLLKDGLLIPYVVLGGIYLLMAVPRLDRRGSQILAVGPRVILHSLAGVSVGNGDHPSVDCSGATSKISPALVHAAVDKLLFRPLLWILLVSQLLAMENDSNFERIVAKEKKINLQIYIQVIALRTS